MHKWLTDNDWDIVQTVVKGTKFSGQNSQVKLTSLVTVQNNLQIPAASLSAATTDEEIDAYLSGDDVSNIALFDHLYPEYNLEWREDKLRQLFDWVPVDSESVKAYVYWLETESKMIQGPKKDLALRQALSILGIAAVTKGYYLQRKKISPFGRTYYEGTSVQNVNKELRRAMLGNCWEYDIRSSVVAWKMGYARGYLAASGLDQDLKKSFPATLLYLEDKADFMATVRHYVFPESSPVPKELRPKLLKQVQATIEAKKVSISEEDARDLAKRALQFKMERGRLPDINSADAWEKRMAEGVAALARYRAQAKAAEAKNNNG